MCTIYTQPLVLVLDLIGTTGEHILENTAEHMMVDIHSVYHTSSEKQRENIFNCYHREPAFFFSNCACLSWAALVKRGPLLFVCWFWVGRLVDCFAAEEASFLSGFSSALGLVGLGMEDVLEFADRGNFEGVFLASEEGVALFCFACLNSWARVMRGVFKSFD
mmetsp:Transcript_14821/g.19552  ORF Transcript_14821/g.19552 Transcript_14821/m.19552 type:complete len:163 (-) Transcript_14821:471-959(-)